jgi:hypothetical protein
MDARDTVPDPVVDLLLHLDGGPDAVRVSELPGRLQDADVLAVAEQRGLVRRIAVQDADPPRVSVGFHPQSEAEWRASYGRLPMPKRRPSEPERAWVPAGADGSHVELTAKGRRLLPELRLARMHVA